MEAKTQARIDLIKAVRARTMANRKEKEAQSLGLGDAVKVATTIAKTRKELAREFKVPPRKGVRNQASIQKRKVKDAASIQAEHDKAYNPRIKGLAGIDGIVTAEDGTISLAELREQRPEVFNLKPQPVEGKPPSASLRALHANRIAAGKKDRYEHIFSD